MSKLTRSLESAPPWRFALYSISFSFAVYFCAFAFRKPFSVALFQGTADLPLLPPIDYKILLIVAQILGYTLAKFAGIKFVSETAPHRRAFVIVACILVAEAALLLFGLTPRPWNVVFLFINGMPLGMLWGLVFSYLEGRRLTDLLGPGLSLSFIVGSGATKSVGSYVLAAGVSEQWMPFVTGLIFLPPFLLSIWLLNQLPPPNKEDELKRTKRLPMNGRERLQFFRSYAPGLTLSVLTYMTVTAYRDFRDNFAREIWDALGYAQNPKIFAISELPIAVGVLIALGMIVLIKDNKRSFVATYCIMFTGALLIGLSTLGFQLDVVGPAAWMIIVGLGLYLVYVPFGSTLYDNLVGLTQYAGTAAFMIQVSDACGYLGSVGLLLYKNFGHPELSWLSFLVRFSYAASVLVIVCLAVSLGYFLKKIEKRPAALRA